MNRHLEITKDISDYQVFQGSVDGTANIELAGRCSGKVRSIEGRLLAGKSTVRGFGWAPVGRVAKGAWRVSIERVPAGGHYSLELRFRGDSGRKVVELRYDRLLVGDIWMLGGQSNMQGVGRLHKTTPSHRCVHCYSMAEQWEKARDPLHWLAESVDPVHWPCPAGELDAARRAERRDRTHGAGLGLQFAREMYRRTRVPIGLVPCAHGGTSMDQWSPGLKSKGGHSLYGSMLRRFHAVGGRVAGMLWYQGESDAQPQAAAVFAENLGRFVRSVRSDFGHENLPFIQVQIGRVIAPDEGFAGWNAVQEVQRKAPEKMTNVLTVPAVDLELEDAIHPSTKALKLLGKRMAIAACAMLHPDSGLKAGPVLKSVELAEDGTAIRVRYSNVNSCLKSNGPPSGFCIADAGGTELPFIHRVELDKRQPDCVVLRLVGPLFKGTALWYGHGLNPYCNLVDCERMAAPVFGPVQLL